MTPVIARVAAASSAVKTLTGLKPMSVSSALYLASFATTETTIGISTW